MPYVLSVLILLFSIVLPFTHPNSVSAATKHKKSNAAPIVGNLPNPIYYQNKVIVLTYHHIDQEEKGYTISPKHFASHLRALKENMYHVISMEQYLQWVRTGEPIPPNAVVITFDDGYESFYTHAYPLLKRYGFPATHFIVVGKTDHPNPKGIPHMTWDQMREMKRNGMSFYNHTYDSHYYHNTNAVGNAKAVLANPVFLDRQNRVETADEYKSRIKADLALAEKRLHEELGEQPKLLAFPYGQYNDTVINVGKELGIELYFLYLQEGIIDRQDTIVKRINAGSPNVTPDVLLSKMRHYNQK